MLTDKLETNFKGTRYPDALQKTMGGILGHAIVSMEEEYPYDRETDEPFNVWNPPSILVQSPVKRDVTHASTAPTKKKN